MNFGEALDAMKRGEKVTRKTWKDCQYLYINKDNVIKHYDDSLKEEMLAIACITSDSLLADDWVIKMDTPKVGDIVHLEGCGNGIITRCRPDGQYTIMVKDGSFLVGNIFNFTIRENHRELVDDIREILN